MTKEAYVSFEVAKLLKEKGFNESCDNSYTEDGEFVSNLLIGYKDGASIIVSDQTIFPYKAPTHQMSVAWLREKEIQISIEWCVNGYYGYIINNNDEDSNHILEIRDSYEEAVEAALKYALENLI